MNSEKTIEQKKNIVKRLYDWVLGWAETKYGSPALFALSFAESSFFPIPADVLLIALSLSKPKQSYYYAFICTLGSVIGGLFGYFIGLEFMEIVGRNILEFYGAVEKFDEIGGYYHQYDAWAVAVAGFTPIPYKVFTIAAGAFKISLTVFTVASILGRGARFFIVSSLIFFFGPSIKSFIDKYFNILVVAFTILLIAGFILIKLFI